MNTKAVAELLGISTRTVQRWVKQLKLNMNRNELGHFIFTDEDIELLKNVQKQLHDGIQLQDITLERSKRTGIMKYNQKEELHSPLVDKITNIETSLYQKTDSVVSYQLLQHRREIDELQEQITTLNERVATLEELLKKDQESASSAEDHEFNKTLSSRKKKSFLRGFFGF